MRQVVESWWTILVKDPRRRIAHLQVWVCCANKKWITKYKRPQKRAFVFWRRRRDSPTFRRPLNRLQAIPFESLT